MSQLRLLWSYRATIVQAIGPSSGPQNPNALQCLELLTKQIKSFGKAFRRMQHLSPMRFVKLPNCTALVLFYWEKVVEAGHASPDLLEGECDRDTTAESSLLKSASIRLRFLHSSLLCPSYSSRNGTFQGELGAVVTKKNQLGYGNGLSQWYVSVTAQAYSEQPSLTSCA